MLFYSRGGSIPRGGGRIDALLRAAPAESVSGVLRFTEQGESIAQNFGLRANAMRTLERAFNTLALATLAVRRGVTVQESVAFADVAAQAATASRDSWRRLVDGPGLLSGVTDPAASSSAARHTTGGLSATGSGRGRIRWPRPARGAWTPWPRSGRAPSQRTGG